MIVNDFTCSLQQCCFFYPLRKGLLIWGYLNLIRYCVQDGTASAITAARIQFHFRDNDDPRYQDLMSITLMFIMTLTLALTNLVFNIVFIVGLHKRDDRILRPHYYFWMVTLILYMMLLIGANIVASISKPFYEWLSLHMDPVTQLIAIEQTIIGIVDIVVQVYFLVLVRNQIRILDKGDQAYMIDPLEFDQEIRDRRPHTLAGTVQSAIETQPRLNTHTHRF